MTVVYDKSYLKILFQKRVRVFDHGIKTCTRESNTSLVEKLDSIFFEIFIQKACLKAKLL